MVTTPKLLCALAVLTLSGCGDDFTYTAGIAAGRFEVREIRSDGSVGFVVPSAGFFELQRTGDSHLDVLPIRLRLSRSGEPDRMVTLYSECANACNGSVNCAGQTIVHEAVVLGFTTDGLVDTIAARWTCTFDDGTAFLIIS